MVPVRILQGDCREVLATLPAQSVHCVITSPPYFGLRDYSTGEWKGGSHDCDHAYKSQPQRDHNSEGGFGDTRGKEAWREGTAKIQYTRHCPKCGALRIDNQVGLEPTLEEYVAQLVTVFAEVRRVLRDDGTLWLNLGDTFVDKQLQGIPWRVAFALQADGWYLRSAITWSKPNPMPESVTDRPTSSYEMVFMLAKQPTYFYDAEAIKEPSAYPDDDRKARSAEGQKRMPTEWVAGVRPGSATYPTRNIRNVWTIATAPSGLAHFALMPTELVTRCIKAGSRPGDTVLDPFAGAGTTGLVAEYLNRKAVLIELSDKYCKMAYNRIPHPDAFDFVRIVEIVPDPVRHIP
jgi:DNA modification methylase